MRTSVTIGAGIASSVAAASAQAQLAVSSNDHKVMQENGVTVAVQNMLQKNIQVFENDDGKLTDTGQKIDVGGGAVAIRASTDR